MGSPTDAYAQFDGPPTLPIVSLTLMLLLGLSVMVEQRVNQCLGVILLARHVLLLCDYLNRIQVLEDIGMSSETRVLGCWLEL